MNKDIKGDLDIIISIVKLENFKNMLKNNFFLKNIKIVLFMIK